MVIYCVQGTDSNQDSPAAWGVVNKRLKDAGHSARTQRPIPVRIRSIMEHSVTSVMISRTYGDASHATSTGVEDMSPTRASGQAIEAIILFQPTERKRAASWGKGRAAGGYPGPPLDP